MGTLRLDRRHQSRRDETTRTGDSAISAPPPSQIGGPSQRRSNSAQLLPGQAVTRTRSRRIRIRSGELADVNALRRQRCPGQKPRWATDRMSAPSALLTGLIRATALKGNLQLHHAWKRAPGRYPAFPPRRPPASYSYQVPVRLRTAVGLAHPSLRASSVQAWRAPGCDLDPQNFSQSRGRTGRRNARASSAAASTSAAVSKTAADRPPLTGLASDS